MNWKRGRNKFNNQKCTCNLGHKHDSRGEANYCNELQLMVKAGEIKSFEIQRKYPLILDRKSMGYMRVDFEVINKDGKTEIQEYKGMSTSTWALKVKIFKVCYPGIEYKVIWHGKGRK